MPLNYNDYTCPLPYPDRKDYTTTYYYKNGNLVKTVIHAEHDLATLKDISSAYRGYVCETVVDRNMYDIAKKKYNDKINELQQTFMHDLLEYHDIPVNTFSLHLYSYAEERGRGSGFSEVANIFGEMAELYEIAKTTFSKGQ